MNFEMLENKVVPMNVKFVALIIIALLAGSGIGYFVSMLQVSTLTKACERVEEAYEQLVKYFFVKESNFSVSLDENVWWGVEAWNRNPDSVSEIRNGVLHLFYNETKGEWFGNSGVFQSRHKDGRYTNQLWVGRSEEEANSSDYVILPKSMLSGKFWLNATFKILKMGFNRYPSALDPNARINLGLTLMCAINDEPFTPEAQTLWLDIYFAGYSLNEANIWVIKKDEKYVTIHEDIHAGYFVWEVNPSELGKEISISVDLGEYISKTLNIITQVDIKTIRVYGFIVFVECLGAYAEVEYDQIETYT